MEHYGAIFIHAGFRTSSTFLIDNLWSLEPVFRIYEPLHEALSVPTHITHRGDTMNGQPYAGLENPLGGVRGYRKEFSAERLFLSETADHPALRSYFAILLGEAKHQKLRPVIKEVRSQGRIGWLKRNFAGYHIALLRNPCDQFRSYLWNARHDNWYFMAQLCQSYALNVIPFASDWTIRQCDIPVYWDESFAKQNHFYERLAKSIGTLKLYFMFIYMWAKFSRLAYINSDIVIELPLEGPVEDVNARLAEIGAGLNLEHFHPSRARLDQFESAAMDDVATLAFYCGRDSEPILKPMRNSVFLQAETKKYLDLAFSCAPIQLSATRAFRQEAERNLLELETVNIGRGSFSKSTNKPFVGYGYRLTSDTDNTQRFTPEAIYLAGGANLSGGGNEFETYIDFRSEIKSLVCFGPHFPLMAGAYELLYDIETSYLKNCCRSPVVTIFILDGADAREIRSEISFIGTGRRTILVSFTLGETATSFEPRLMSENACVKVFGMQITQMWTAPRL